MTYVQFSIWYLSIAIPVSPVTKSAIELMVFSLHNSYRTASADKIQSNSDIKLTLVTNLDKIQWMNEGKQYLMTVYQEIEKFASPN